MADFVVFFIVTLDAYYVYTYIMCNISKEDPMTNAATAKRTKKDEHLKGIKTSGPISPPHAKEVVRTLFETPHAVNLSSSDSFEVQPGVYSSVYINLKALISNAASRGSITKALAEHGSRVSADYICGIEIGGCYFASSVADLLGKDLFFYRKADKKYNSSSRIVGNEPTKGSCVVVIDDVLSSGRTIAPIVNELTEKGCVVHVLSIFSYGWERQIAQRLGVEVHSLSSVNDLIIYGSAAQLLSAHSIQLMEEYVAREENRLVESRSKE